MSDDDRDIMYNEDPDCEHDIQQLWSGIKCTKCGAWDCY